MTLKPEDLPAFLIVLPPRILGEGIHSDLAAEKRTAAAWKCGGSPFPVMIRYFILLANASLPIIQKAERKKT